MLKFDYIDMGENETEYVDDGDIVEEENNFMKELFSGLSLDEETFLKEVLNENIFIEDIQSTDNKKGSVKKAKSIAERDKKLPAKIMDKIKNTANGIKKLAKGLYNVKDEDFVNGKVFPQLTRLIVRLVMIAGISKVGFLIGFGPVPALLTAFTSRAIKNKENVKQRQRLRDYYSDKIDYIDDKIENAKTPEEKYSYNKIRTELNNNLKKISMVDKNGKDKK
jgi:hypothetical protein